MAKIADFQGWTSEQRLASLALTKKAIASGELPKPTKCELCGQDKGIIQYHNNDYSHPTKYLSSLCWRCHMMLHSCRRSPEAVKKYFDAVASGKRFAPVYRHDFKVLADEHGVE